MLNMNRRNASCSHESRQSNASAASRLSAKITSKVKHVVHKIEKLGKKHNAKHQLVKPAAGLAYTTEGTLNPLQTNLHLKVSVFAHDGSADIHTNTATTTHTDAFEPGKKHNTEHQLVNPASILGYTTEGTLSPLKTNLHLKVTIFAEGGSADIQTNTATTTHTIAVDSVNIQANTAIITDTNAVDSAAIQADTASTTDAIAVDSADIQINTAITTDTNAIDFADIQTKTATATNSNAFNSANIQTSTTTTTDSSAFNSANIQTTTATSTDTRTVEPAVVDTEVVGMVKRRKTMFSRLTRKSIDATAQLKPKLVFRRSSLPKPNMAKFEALIRKFSPTGRRSKYAVRGDGDIRGIYYPEKFYRNYRPSPESEKELALWLSRDHRPSSPLSMEGYIPAPTCTASGSPLDWGENCTDLENPDSPPAAEWTPTSSSSLDQRVPTPYPMRLDSSPGAPCPYTPTPSPWQGKPLIVKKRNQRRNVGYPRRSSVDFALPPPRFRLAEAIKAENEWWQYLESPLSASGSPRRSPSPSSRRSRSPPPARPSARLSFYEDEAASLSPSPCRSRSRSPPPARPSARLSYYEDEEASLPPYPSSSAAASPYASAAASPSPSPAASVLDITLADLADILVGANHPDRHTSGLEEEALQARIPLPIRVGIPAGLVVAEPRPISVRVVGKMEAMAWWGM